MSVNRRKMTGTGERGDKVRTYRFQDNTVKDHRSGKQLALDKIMSGHFNLLW
jgi:protein subunit release factor A